MYQRCCASGARRRFLMCTRTGLESCTRFSGTNFTEPKICRGGSVIHRVCMKFPCDPRKMSGRGFTAWSTRRGLGREASALNVLQPISEPRGIAANRLRATRNSCTAPVGKTTVLNWNGCFPINLTRLSFASRPLREKLILRSGDHLHAIAAALRPGKQLSVLGRGVANLPAHRIPAQRKDP